MMVITICQPLIAQIPNGSTRPECNEDSYQFTDVRDPTLCEQYGHITFDTKVGAGTPFTHSSLITPIPSTTIRIIGDLIIDNDFPLNGAIVKINSGVSIIMLPNSKINLSNSKLFACTGLWKGIIMDNFTTVNAKNNTEIEDAEIAIQSANKSYTFLNIESTTFNRNRIGIQLDNTVPSIQSPIMPVFKNNIFRCNAPLNGTTNEITNTGIEIKNVDNAFLDLPSNTNNFFSRIQSGITIEGESSDISIYGYTFFGIKDKAIHFQGRELKVENSIFNHIGKYGIYFQKSTNFELKNNEFYLLEPEQNYTFRYMVHIQRPNPGNSINIEKNYFSAEGRLSSSTNFALALYDGLVSIFEYNARIFENTFDILNSSNETHNTNPCHAICLWTEMGASSDVDIESNYINLNSFVSPTTSHTNPNNGIYSILGSKNNVHIIGNDFTGNGNHIYLEGSEGEGNEVSTNEHFQASHFGTGLFSKNFQNLKVCSNLNNSASNVSYLFNGSNNNMTFSNNITYGGTQHSLWLSTSQTIIGQQIQTANEWYPGLRPVQGGFVRDHPFLEHRSNNDETVELSKFFVHESQSSFNINTQQYDQFSKFHPAFIVPDQFPREDVFFEFENGTPNNVCATQMTIPDEGDKKIADGTYINHITSPALAWDGQRHLYKKLKSNPIYENAYSGFSDFLQNNASSNIGKFYELEQKIQNAVEMPIIWKNRIKEKQVEIKTINQQISTLIQNGIYTELLLTPLAEQRSTFSESILDILAEYNNYKLAKLNEAETILQTIATTTEHEDYRKTVFSIYLQSQLYQNGTSNANQTTILKEIAKLCAERVGMITYTAQGFLQNCDFMDIEIDRKMCDPELVVEPRNRNSNNSVDFIEGTLEKDFFFYPNPTQGKLVFSNKKEVLGRAEILTMTGQLLKSYTINKDESFWNIDLPSGVYVIKITFENGETLSDKLIINK